MYAKLKRKIALFCIPMMICSAIGAMGEITNNSDNLPYAEDEVVTFENENNGLYESENGYIIVKPKMNVFGSAGMNVVDELNNTDNKVAVIKNLYETDSEGNFIDKNKNIVDKDSPDKVSKTSAVIVLNDFEANISHRINWRMKVPGNSRTEFHLESETSTSKPDFEFLAYTGVSSDGVLLNPNHYSGTNQITNELTKPNITLSDNKWHNFEAYFYSDGKSSDNNRKIVELYCDGVLYAIYERSFPHSLKQIEIYSTGVPNADAMYIDDISLSRIPNEFYMTADYNADSRCLEATMSLYPDAGIGETAAQFTFDGALLTPNKINGRKIQYVFTEPLEEGKIYSLNAPMDLTSDGKYLLNAEINIEVPPEQPGIVEVKTGKIGNVFIDSDDLKFNVRLTNTDGLPQSFEGRAWITAEDGSIVWNAEKVDNISAADVAVGGVSEIEFDPNLTDPTHAYGRFYFNTEIRPAGKQSYKKQTREFTIFFSNGFVNDKSGVCTHYSRTKKNSLGNWSDDIYSVGEKGNIKGIIDLQSKAGFGTARDDTLSYSYYKTRNSVPSEFAEKTYKNYNEKGINLIQILSMSFYSKTGLYRSGTLAYEGLHMMPISYVDESGNIDKSELNEFKNKVKDFTSFNSRSHTYELFNEWNLSTWKKKFDLYERKGNEDVLVKKDYEYTIDQYVEAVRTASEGIRESDPQARILGFGAGKDNMEEFIEECLKKGMGQYIDAVSVHPYSVNVAPEIGHKDKWDTESVPLREKIKSVQNLLDKYNLDLPIIITEIGWTNAPDTPITDAIQAQYSIRALGLAGDLTESISLYEMIEHNNSDPYEQHYGMLYQNDDSDNALGAKPVFGALSCFNSLTADKARTEGIVEDKNSGSIYCTYENECERVIMYWNPDKDNQQLSIPKGTNESRAYSRDMYGNIIKETVDERNGFYAVSAGTSPQYLIIDKSCDDDLYVTMKYLKADGLKMTKNMEERLIKTKTDANIEFKTAYKNNGFYDKEISAILAAYDETGKLTNVSLKTYTLKSGQTLMPTDMPNIIRKDKEKVKAYIWDLKLIKPVSYNDEPRES
mgnify:CR=1 FL=1